jgi:hypothetical protein
MLALYCSQLNEEYFLINVLKTLASILSMCSLYVIFLSKIPLRYFTVYANGMFTGKLTINV